MGLGAKANPRVFVNNFLFDLGFMMGKSDCKHFKLKLGPKSYISLISLLGPQLAYSGTHEIPSEIPPTEMILGRAVMELYPEISILPDDNFKMHFDLHESVESHAYLHGNINTINCVCFLNAGYTSGKYKKFWREIFYLRIFFS